MLSTSLFFFAATIFKYAVRVTLTSENCITILFKILKIDLASIKIIFIGYETYVFQTPIQLQVLNNSVIKNHKDSHVMYMFSGILLS